MYEWEEEEEQTLDSQLMMPWSFMEFCSLGHWVPDALDLQKSVHDNQRPFFFLCPVQEDAKQQIHPTALKFKFIEQLGVKNVGFLVLTPVCWRKCWIKPNLFYNYWLEAKCNHELPFSDGITLLSAVSCSPDNAIPWCHNSNRITFLHPLMALPYSPQFYLSFSDEITLFPLLPLCPFSLSWLAFLPGLSSSLLQIYEFS